MEVQDARELLQVTLTENCSRSNCFVEESSSQDNPAYDVQKTPGRRNDDFRSKTDLINNAVDTKNASENLLALHFHSYSSKADQLCGNCGKKTTFTEHNCAAKTDKPRREFVCSVCGKTVSNKHNLKCHMIIHGRPKLQLCPFCGKHFNLNYLIKVHINRVHKGLRPPAKEKKLKCDYCQGKFASPTHLRIHLRKHTGEKPYKCEICSKAFSQKSSMRNHIKIHTGEKTFQCELCGELVKSSSALTRHIAAHTGQRDFKCDTCGLTFVYKSGLKQHQLRHTRDCLQTCPLCGRTFLDKSTLKTHLKLHEVKRYRCNVCSKGFDDQECLDKHMEYHTEPKPFQCAECQKSFSDKQLLLSHQKCHSKEKPYECEICGNRYSWRSSYSCHRRRHLQES